MNDNLRFEVYSTRNASEACLVRDLMQVDDLISVGAGMGVANEVEQTSAGELVVPAGDAAFIRVVDVELEFRGKEVDEKVTV